jgi:hypothetical protein
MTGLPSLRREGCRMRNLLLIIAIVFFVQVDGPATTSRTGLKAGLELRRSGRRGS